MKEKHLQDEEKERIKQERLAAYAAKKSKKPGVVAKSNVIFDVKPWDDSTDMAELEQLVRGIEKDGLVWGTSKLAPVAYGIKKLTIGWSAGFHHRARSPSAAGRRAAARSARAGRR